MSGGIHKLAKQARRTLYDQQWEKSMAKLKPNQRDVIRERGAVHFDKALLGKLLPPGSEAIATRSRSLQRRRASVTISVITRVAASSYASHVIACTPARPSA